MSIFIYMDYQIKFKNKETCTNVFLSSYFVTSKNLFPKDNFDVISKLYNSFKEIYEPIKPEPKSQPKAEPQHETSHKTYSLENTHLRIFHDNLSSDFIKKFSTKKIKFIKVATKEIHYSPIDILYLSAHQYMLHNKDVRNFFVRGNHDVKIVNNPFLNFPLQKSIVLNDDIINDSTETAPEKKTEEVDNPIVEVVIPEKNNEMGKALFISNESSTLIENTSLIHKLKTLDISLKDLVPEETLKSRPLLSSNLIGGTKEVLSRFMEMVIPFIIHINKKYREFTKNKNSFSTTSVKTSINYYSLFEEKIITGFPFYTNKAEYDILNDKEKNSIMFTLDTI